LNDQSPVTQLLSRARRRSITHLVLDQSSLALTIGMGGAILLMLIGTQILDWYWVALLAVASLAVGIYRLRKTVPTTYRLAQRIDRRLNLADALSTAWFFSRGNIPANLASHEAVRERQRENAEEVARGVDLTVGVPFSRPRYALPALALAAVAFGLFAVRYAVIGKMDMQRSLVAIALDTFFPEKQLAAKNRHNNPLKAPDIDTGSPDAPTTQNEENPENMLDAADSPPDASNADAMDQSKSAAKQGSQSDQPEASQGNDKGSDKGDKSASNDQNQDGKQGDSKDGKQNAKDGKQGQGNESSSMMDKLKDAMANMLNKMKSSQKDGQQSQQNAQNQQQNGQQDKASKGQPSQNKSDPSNSSQSDQQGDGADKSQSADSKGSEKGSDKQASPDSKSGIGSADGDKTAKEAAEQAAMGKISEILGKRSQNVTGEVMVEVGSTKQQLKTPWAQKQAAHAEAGSEIHRDEVPLMYQPFVQQYFEEIRKAAPAAKAPAKAAPKDPPKNPAGF
jgi:hypothetical protein